MRYLRNTIKWEVRKWRAHVLPFVLMVLAAWLVMLVLQMVFAPVGSWEDLLEYGTTVEVTVMTFILTFGGVSALVGLAIATHYPVVSAIGYEFCKKNLLEHGSGRPYATAMAVRMSINVMTYVIGTGILTVTFLLMGRSSMYVCRTDYIFYRTCTLAPSLICAFCLYLPSCLRLYPAP